VPEKRCYRYNLNMDSRQPSLRLFQGLSVCVLLRDEEGARQGLKILADIIETDHEGQDILRVLDRSMTPNDRFWFGNLHGPRNPRRIRENLER
jgi:hypothetical protein